MIAFAADAKAISGPQRYLPALVVISGVIISVLLSWLAYALSSPAGARRCRGRTDDVQPAAS
ncbi:hypothetical protein ACTMU2_21500 [Cupriavidus basilensis]